MNSNPFSIFKMPHVVYDKLFPDQIKKLNFANLTFGLINRKLKLVGYMNVRLFIMLIITVLFVKECSSRIRADILA